VDYSHHIQSRVIPPIEHIFGRCEDFHAVTERAAKVQVNGEEFLQQ